MFFSKEMKKADKEIRQKKEVLFDSQGDVVIAVKAMTKDKIFSSYDYDSNEKLNDELCDYVWDKARFVPAKSDVRVKIYVNEPVNQDEVRTAFKMKYKQECTEIRSEMKRNSWFILAMVAFGILCLTLLVLAYKYFNYVYFDTVIEIFTWVFWWEAVDAFFLRRTEIRRRYVRTLKLYMAQIDVVKIRAKKSSQKIS